MSDPRNIGAAIDWSGAATWYDRNAESYEMRSLELPPPAPLLEFTEGLTAGARVLDLGCGAGRDLRWLCDQGYRAEGMDLSAQMITAARSNTGGRAPLRHQDIADFRDPPGSWDAIWAMASLLHLPKSALQGCLSRLLGSLTETGRLFVGLKEGHGESIDAHGRPFSYWQVEELTRIGFAAMPGPGHVTAHVETAGSFDTNATRWISLDLRRSRPF